MQLISKYSVYSEKFISIFFFFRDEKALCHMRRKLQFRHLVVRQYWHGSQLEDEYDALRLRYIGLGREFFQLL